MEKQKNLIHSKDWNCLIILDACRFDYFKNNFRDFFDGSLRKVNSNAVHTGEWLNNTFQDYYQDITYISASPCVNSYGLSLLKTNPYWEIDWTAAEHFPKIIDVWEFGWSKKLESVPPIAVTETALKAKGRKIVHYMQPHAPYLKLKEKDKKRKENSHIREMLPRSPARMRAKGKGNSLFSAVEGLGNRLTGLFGLEALWEIKKGLGIPPFESMEEAWRLGTIYKVYLDNLHRAMREVARLVKSVNGRVVVTSDHGECLGENGYWGHTIIGGKKIPRIASLVNVPWLVVENA